MAPRARLDLCREKLVAKVEGRVAQLVRALVSHTRGPGFESLRDHFGGPVQGPAVRGRASFLRTELSVFPSDTRTEFGVKNPAGIIRVLARSQRGIPTGRIVRCVSSGSLRCYYESRMICSL